MTRAHRFEKTNIYFLRWAPGFLTPSGKHIFDGPLHSGDDVRRFREPTDGDVIVYRIGFLFLGVVVLIAFFESGGPETMKMMSMEGHDHRHRHHHHDDDEYHGSKKSQ